MKSRVVVKRWLSLMAALMLCLGTTSMVAAQHGGVIGEITAPGGGMPPAGTLVKLFEPGVWDAFGQAQVQSDGSFSLAGIPHGQYVLKAVPPAGSGLTQSLPIPVSIFNAVVDVGTFALTHPQIVGTVTTPDGVTPAPADVLVYAANGMIIQHNPAPGGDLRVGGLPAGTYGLQALPATDDPYWQSPVMPVTVGTVSQTLTITLHPAEIHGYVFDPLGNPVPNALVSAAQLHNAPPSHEPRHTDRTNASGYYAIGGLITGTYRLEAAPPWDAGSLLPAVPITATLPPVPQQHDLTLRDSPKIVSGTVETNTGTPVEAALIQAHRLDKHGHARTLSEPDGGYRLHLSDGLWSLSVRPITSTIPAEWIYPHPPQLVHFQHNLEPEHKQQDFLVLTADAAVSGTVAMPDGSPPPFTVTLSLRNDEGIGLHHVVEPGGDGAFNVALPHGGYKVWVRPEVPDYLGPIVEPIQVPPETTYDLGTLTLLERSAVVTGTVTDASGTPVTNIPVVAWRPAAPGGGDSTTGPDGIYALTLVEGDWMIRPAPGPDQPYLFTEPAVAVTLAEGETLPDVDFSLIAADATLVGTLVDENGAPVTDAEGWADATHIFTSTIRSGAPIEAGGFSLTLPEGIYRVAAHLPAGSRYTSAGTRYVTLTAGETATVTLTVKEKDAHINGALWDPREEVVVPGVGGRVLAWAGSNWVQTTIDPGNGTYHLDVASGLWHLGYEVAPDSGYVGLVDHKNVPVPSGQTVTVPLPVVERDGIITGTVLGPSGAPLSGAKVIALGNGPQIDDLHLVARTNAEGAFRLPVPHGIYRLGATVGITESLKPAERLVTVPEGGVSGEHMLQFRQPDATISGTLAISATAPLTGSIHIWGWSPDGAFVKAHVPITSSTGTYSLDVLSNTTWHLGAAFETQKWYWFDRALVAVGESGATQDLVLTGPHPKPAPVAVTFDAAQPQRIVLEDGTHIYIPAGSLPVTGRVTLHITPIATLPHQQHANVYKYGYAFIAVDSDGEPITAHFNQEVAIGFAYDEVELHRAGIWEHLLKPAYFSTTDNRWSFPTSYVIDTEHDQVVMQIDHFTDFALMAEPGAMIYLPMVLR